MGGIKTYLLFAFIFLIAAQSAFAQECGGSCTACSNLSNQTACQAQGGCSWTTSTCTGTPTACKDLSFENCLTHGGCSWLDPPGKCQGTPDSCPTYNTNQSLCVSGGCTWNPAACSGTCTACTTFSTQGTCGAQAGCIWDPGIVCGNNTKETGETCDGTDLAGQTCITQGFDGGTLACNTNCLAFDTSSCISYVCGNNTKEGTETCDGTDLAGQTCITQGFTGGTLTCKSDCTGFTTTVCTSSTCGNNVKETGEICDGTDLSGQTCIIQGFTGGTLSCKADCGSFITTACTLATCGNNTKEGNETCDGTDLSSQTCITRGFTGGTLTCIANCSAFDTSGCTGEETTTCGNDIIEGDEVCDGSDLGGYTCANLGFESGSLACLSDCTNFDMRSCGESQELLECEGDCCGNSLCEKNKNEDFITCRADCPTPESLSFNFLSPENDVKFARGETLLVKVELISDSAHPSASDVEWVKATGFFGTADLYDDGQHKDGAEADSVYANSFLIGKDVEAAEYTLTVEAKVAGTEQAAEEYFIVDPILGIEVSLDKETYVLGDIIEISGSVKKGSLASKASLNLKIEFGETELFEWSGTSNDEGLYGLNFQTLLFSQPGEWVLTLEAADEYENEGSVSKKINVAEAGALYIATGAALGAPNAEGTGFGNLIAILLIAAAVAVISFLLSWLIFHYIRWKKKGFHPFRKLLEKLKRPNKFR